MSVRESATHKRLIPSHATALGTVLRAARESAALTQEEVAADSGVSVQMVRRLEAGSANPTLGTLAAVVGALDTTIADVTQRAGL